MKSATRGVQSIVLASAAYTLGTLGIISQPAHAFKLNTHAKLAEEVYNDAKDGKVSIRIFVEPGSPAARLKGALGKKGGKDIGRALGMRVECTLSGSNKPVRKGGPANQWPQYSALDSREMCFATKEYPVANVYLDALRSANGFNGFIQGSLGPDVYPDMLTGQKIIHPHEGSHDATTAQWLAKVYWIARENKKASKDKSNLAFALGYTFHAIGDVYAHTVVNKYAGGPFALGENAIRHIVVEGTLAKFLPSPSKATLAARLNSANLDFVYDSLIKAGKDEGNLYNDKNPNTDYSVPFVYESLRLDLAGDEKTYRRRAKKCSWYDPTCSAVANKVKAAYVDAWQKDITQGLKVWPGISQKAGVYMGFNASGKMQVSKLQDLYSDYTVNHILSMSGAPDALGYTISAIGNLTEAITPDWILDKIKQFKKELANYLVKEATGKNLDQWARAFSQDAKDVISSRAVAGLVESSGMKPESNADRFIAVNEMWDKDGNINSSEAFIQYSPWFNGTVQLGKVMLLTRADTDKLAKWINENACAEGTCYGKQDDKAAQSYEFVTPIWWASKLSNCGKNLLPVYGTLCAGGVASIDDPSGLARDGGGKWTKPWFIRALFDHVGPTPGNSPYRADRT